MVDIAKAIEPRSDQQNYDDYVAGPRTVTVTEVDRDKEQRVSIHLAEYPGRPFKPSKTNLRLIAQAWGTEAAAWTGRRMTLAGDPTVKFGGQQVGGIRVVALSHIDKPFTAALTATRGKRTTYKVDALPDAPAPPPIPEDVQTLAQYQDYYRHRAQNGAGPDELAMIQQNAPTNEENNA